MKAETVLSQNLITPFFMPIVSIGNKGVKIEVLTRIPDMRLDAFFKDLKDEHVHHYTYCFLSKLSMEIIALGSINLPIISINLFPKQLHNPDLRNALKCFCKSINIDTCQLQFELIEGTKLTNFDLGALYLLKEEGFLIASDDYTNTPIEFEKLGKFPFDSVKIDQSLVRSSLKSDVVLYQLCSTIEMLKARNFSVTVEGIESNILIPLLGKMGTSHLQGYLFGKPKPLSEYSDSVWTQAFACLPKHENPTV